MRPFQGRFLEGREGGLPILAVLIVTTAKRCGHDGHTFVQNRVGTVTLFCRPAHFPTSLCSCNVLYMSRRTTPAAKRDDLVFPVRIKLEVPPDGLGRVLDEIHAWLRAHLEPGAFATHSAARIGGSAMAIYFMCVGDAAKFIAAFPQTRLAGNPQDTLGGSAFGS